MKKQPTSAGLHQLASLASPPLTNHAGDCRCCRAHLVKLGREQRTEVYAERGGESYCRCLNCQATWKRKT